MGQSTTLQQPPEEEFECTEACCNEGAEYEQLRKEMELSSLGDRPQSISAKKLRRLIDLQKKKITGEL